MVLCLKTNSETRFYLNKNHRPFFTFLLNKNRSKLKLVKKCYLGLLLFESFGVNYFILYSLLLDRLEVSHERVFFFSLKLTTTGIDDLI